MPPTPFSSIDDSEGATISGTDGDAVFKSASNGSTTVNGVTPLSTNLGGGVVRVDTSSSFVGINTNPARDFHVNSSSQNECARFESTDTEVAVEFKDTTGTATLKCRNDFRFDNSTGELLRITATGLVGINEVNPASKLQITTSAGGSDGYLKIKDGTHGGDVRFGIEGGVNNDALLGTFTANGVGIYTDSAKRFSMSEVGFSSFTPSTSSDDYGLSIVTGNSSDTGIVLGRSGASNCKVGLKASSNGANSYFGIQVQSDGDVAYGDASQVQVYPKFTAFNSAKLQNNEVVAVQGVANKNYPAMSVYSPVNDSANRLINFYTLTGTGPTERGFISWDNSGATMTYGTTSDGRLKEVTGEAPGMEFISKLKPVAYTFQGTPTHGLIAQQVLQAYQDVQATPVGVYVPNDPQKEHYQLDYGLLITPLIKAVQQLAARIDDLENR